MSKKMQKNKTNEQKTKRNRILWGTFWATAVTAAIGAGIGIPLAQASKALPKPTPILNPDSHIYRIEDPSGNKIDINYGSIDKNPVLENKNKHIFEEIKKHISKYLYEQEYEASLRYQAIYNANKAKADEKQFALDSIEKITEKVKKELDDLKKQYQKQFGLEKKWEEKFLEELAKDSWGKSKNEAQALDFKINQEIEKNAYLRYKTEVNTDWTYLELKDGIKANKKVSYTIKGEEKVIAEKDRIIRLQDEFNITENVDYVLPKEDSIENQVDSKTSIKIPIFVTKSFVKEFKNPQRFIEPWLNKKQAILSEFALSAKQDETGSEKPWKVTKDEIIKLLKFSAYEVPPKKDETNGKNKKTEIKLGVEKLNDFAGFSNLIKTEDIKEEDEIKANNDKLLINNLSSDTSNANKFGSKGFINLEKTISSEDPSSYLALLSIVSDDSNDSKKRIYKYSQKDNLFDELKKNIAKAFVESKIFKEFEKLEIHKETLENLKKLLNGNRENTMTSLVNNKNDEFEIKKYAQYNSKIEEIINKFDEKDLVDIFGSVFRDTFSNGTNTNNAKKKINALYKVKNNFVSVTSKGILIQNVHQFKDVDQVRKLIVKDLGIKSKANYKSLFTSELFDLTTIFSEVISTNEFQIKDLLENEDFKNHIKNQKFTPIDSDQEKEFSDEDINGATSYISAFEKTNKTSILNNKLDQIEKFIEKQVNDNLIEDFKYNSSENKVTISSHEGLNAVDYIFGTIVEYVLNVQIEKKGKR